MIWQLANVESPAISVPSGRWGTRLRNVAGGTAKFPVVSLRTVLADGSIETSTPGGARVDGRLVCRVRIAVPDVWTATDLPVCFAGFLGRLSLARSLRSGESVPRDHDAEGSGSS